MGSRGGGQSKEWGKAGAVEGAGGKGEGLG